jgi:hypothetical protein
VYEGKCNVVVGRSQSECADRLRPGSILILLLYTEVVMREDFIVQEKASERLVRIVTCCESSDSDSKTLGCSSSEA